MAGGSSPHARGLLAGGVDDSHAVGIIPARAGFTLGLRRRDVPAAGGPAARIIPARAGFTGGTRRRRGWIPDHPRTRGVYSWRPWPTRRGAGSSPHARGLPGREPGNQLLARIIPARAGFTVCLSYWVCCWWDHPRTRGVYRPKSTVGGHWRGSSPHARGLRGHC